MRVTEIIVPFYENLRRIAGVPPAADQTSSMSSEADGDDETMIPVKQPDSVVSKLLAAMEAPSQDLWI